jgi:hypothetical protein
MDQGGRRVALHQCDLALLDSACINTGLSARARARDLRVGAARDGPRVRREAPRHTERPRAGGARAGGRQQQQARPVGVVRACAGRAGGGDGSCGFPDIIRHARPPRLSFSPLLLSPPLPSPPLLSRPRLFSSHLFFASLLSSPLLLAPSESNRAGASASPVHRAIRPILHSSPPSCPAPIVGAWGRGRWQKAGRRQRHATHRAQDGRRRF